MPLGRGARFHPPQAVPSSMNLLLYRATPALPDCRGLLPRSEESVAQHDRQKGVVDF
jgi:hypothetical protein